MLNLKTCLMLLVATVAITVTACNKTDKAQTAPAETQHEQQLTSDVEHSTHDQVANEAEQPAEQVGKQSAQIAAIDQPTTN